MILAITRAADGGTTGRANEGHKNDTLKVSYDAGFDFLYSSSKMTYLPMLIASGMAGIDTLAFSLVKKISEKSILPAFTFIAMGLYALQPLILLQAMPFETVAVMNIIWNLISSVVVTLVSIFFLGETIGMYKMIGIMIGIVSLFLCTLEEIQKYLPLFSTS